jgi:large subunit ribosomal protein L5|tara:strand:- start:983 stop:1525 length:543 start_codon:yes stop_codon:yes gene_type:complete
MARLLEQYRSEIEGRLSEQLGRANRLSLPRLDKIVVNMGVGLAIQDQKRLDEAVSDLSQIVGQRPLVTIARRSVAGFRLREGMKVGCKVTLRGRRMYEFLDRLITLALPRVRDFRGLNPRAFDGQGNYSLGVTEQVVFPEINPDKVTNVQGMDITIVTTARTNEEGHLLLKELGLPFRTD